MSLISKLAFTYGCLLLSVITACSDTSVTPPAGDKQADIASEVPVITDAAKLDQYVDRVVVIRGVLQPTKAPQVLGVILSYADLPDEDLTGKIVECRGLLVQQQVKPQPDDAAPIAQLNPGMYFYLVDPSENDLVQVRAIEVFE